jgi:CubicO group peptidase (beta-lactamase class C family)
VRTLSCPWPPAGSTSAWLPWLLWRTMEAGLAAAAHVYEDAARDGLQGAASIVAARRGRIVLARSFGSAEAAGPDAIFMMASITKPVTALAFMMLVEKGHVSLADAACMYLPEFSEGERVHVTVGHLLSHTSGLPDMLPENTALREARAPLSAFVTKAFATPLLFSPGEDFSYSSMGILLASEILERISGKAIRDFMREKIFQPLGMSRTELGLGPAVRAIAIVPWLAALDRADCTHHALWWLRGPSARVA